MDNEELIPVSGSMFHTNYVGLERKYFCDDDCEQSGCPGHILELKILNTSGTAYLRNDGKNILCLGCNDAQALYEMLKFLVENK